MFITDILRSGYTMSAKGLLFYLSLKKHGINNIMMSLVMYISICVAFVVLIICTLYAQSRVACKLIDLMLSIVVCSVSVDFLLKMEKYKFV